MNSCTVIDFAEFQSTPAGYSLLSAFGALPSATLNKSALHGEQKFCSPCQYFLVKTDIGPDCVSAAISTIWGTHSSSDGHTPPSAVTGASTGMSSVASRQ